MKTPEWKSNEPSDEPILRGGPIRRTAEQVGFAMIAGLLFWLSWTIMVDGELEAAQSASVYRFEGWQKILAVLPFTMGLGLSWSLIRSAWRGLRGCP